MTPLQFMSEHPFLTAFLAFLVVELLLRMTKYATRFEAPPKRCPDCQRKFKFDPSPEED